MPNGRIEGKDLVADSVFAQFEKLDKVIAEQIKRMNELEKSTRNALGGAAIQGNSSAVGETVAKSNRALTEQEKLYKEIARIQERYNEGNKTALRTLISLRDKRTQTNRALKEEAILSNSLVGAYRKLRTERDRASRTLRDLIASEKASNAELRKAQKEFDRLDNKIRKADRATRNFRDNVGNYGSAFRGVATAVRGFAAAFGVYSALQIGREIFDTVKALDALKFGLENVTESQEDFNRAQEFIIELADRAGVSIEALLKRYTNFLAAANTTTLTIQQTQEVFENVVLSSAILGRSTDDLNGALRALEQILSKGKVQAEELRGQLGERLPGAFQILEKALGLANGELNELLELGGLLSVEAIPALTKGLEDAYKLETVDRVETLAAAQARLTNEWSLFILQIEDGSSVLSNFFKGVFEGLAAFVKNTRLAYRTWRQFQEDIAGGARSEGRETELSQLASEAEAAGISIEELATSLKGQYTKELEEAQAQVDVLNEALEEQERLARLLNRPANQDAVDDINRELAAANDLLGDRKGRLDALNEVLQEEVDVTYQFEDAQKNANKAAEEFLEIDSVAFAKELVSTFTTLRDKLNVGSEAWVDYNERLEDATENLKKLQEQQQLLNGDLSPLEFLEEGDLNLAQEIDDFLNTEGVDALVSDLADRLSLSKEETLAEFIEIYGQDFAAFKEYEERKLELVRIAEAEKAEIRLRSAEVLDAVAQSFYEIQLKRLDDEEQRQQEVFEAVVNGKNVSEEQIEIAEKKRFEKEKQIEKERQRLQKQAFLLQQAIEIGKIWIQAATAQAAALAPPPVGLGPVFGATLVPFILANAGLATGIVLAQAIPKFFFRGKDEHDKYQGPAIWGELQREVKVSKDGSLELSPDGPSPTHVKSSDIIMDSLGSFQKAVSNTNSEVFKRVSKGIKTKTSSRMDSAGNFRYAEFLKATEKALTRGVSRAKLNANFYFQDGRKVSRYL